MHRKMKFLVFKKITLDKRMKKLIAIFFTPFSHQQNTIKRWVNTTRVGLSIKVPNENAGKNVLANGRLKIYCNSR